MEKNDNPYKGFFENLSLSLPPDILEKLIITNDVDSEDYNKTFLQKADEYLSIQYELINKLYQEDNKENIQNE